MSRKTSKIDKKINDEVIEKKASELIAKYGNPIIEDFNGYYICENRNKFSKENYSYNLAIIAYYSNENCSDCINCENCTCCQQCNDCKNCTNCEISHYSENCTKCTSVWSCKNCNNCQDCVNCNDCRDCCRCEGCKECFSCEDSKNLNKNDFFAYNQNKNNEEKEKKDILPTIQDILNSR